jgi:hypothetical protein
VADGGSGSGSSGGGEGGMECVSVCVSVLRAVEAMDRLAKAACSPASPASISFCFSALMCCGSISFCLSALMCCGEEAWSCRERISYLRGRCHKREREIERERCIERECDGVQRVVRVVRVVQIYRESGDTRRERTNDT